MTRAYNKSARASAEARTRQRILAALRRQLIRRPIVSLDAVAAEAQVARTTVFDHFGSKSGLLKALLLQTSERAEVAALIVALSSADPLANFRAAFLHGSQVWAKEQKMYRRLFALAAVDPEMARVLAEKERQRQALIAALVASLRKQLAVDVATARRVVQLLSSFESFDRLVLLGATPEAAAELLFSLARTILIPRPKRGHGRPTP